ncbi:MAG: hypothetical protein ACRD6B_12610 [Bryobacteraceae bacterium]
MTPDQRQALLQELKAIVGNAAVKAGQHTPEGILRNWQDILRNPRGNAGSAGKVPSHPFTFRGKNGAAVPFHAFERRYRRADTRIRQISENVRSTGTQAAVLRQRPAQTGRNLVFGGSCVARAHTILPKDWSVKLETVALHPNTPPPFAAPCRDWDQDGISDQLEGQIADSFTPVYHVSAGDPDSFAIFGDYVPETIQQTTGSIPPVSYYRVQPLGLATDSNGAQVFAFRIDYLTLWNADGGLKGLTGPSCAYGYFGLGEVIQEVSSHSMDAEHSAMLVAAPPMNGGVNPNANAYSLYSVYLAAHEGTFWDQSRFADFSPAVPANNHINLWLSLSKHSTYNFNPDWYPITPSSVIAAGYAGIQALYDEGEINYDDYLALEALAYDTFYACAVERFNEQGGFVAQPRINVGEPAHPINGARFIQDNTSNSLYLYQKLTTPIW